MNRRLGFTLLATVPPDRTAHFAMLQKIAGHQKGGSDLRPDPPITGAAARGQRPWGQMLLLRSTSGADPAGSISIRLTAPAVEAMSIS